MHIFSASQINKFMEEPSLWIMKSLFKLKEPQNKWAIRGTVFGDFLETAAVSGHYDIDINMLKNRIAEDCLKADCEVPSLTSIDTDWQVAVKHFQDHDTKGYDRPIASQHKFLIDVKHGKLTGYLDLLYPKAVKDIKYRNEIEREPRQSDMIQLACYWKATGHRQFLFEVSKGKTRLSAYGEAELKEWWEVAEHNMGRMADIVMLYQAMIITCTPREACIVLLKDTPIHNWNGYWFKEARELSLEARR